MTKQIPLTQGKVALVDDEDFERINAHKWYAANRSGKFYAVRSMGPRLFRENTSMHREILDAPSGMEVDHMNGDTLDNRRANIRVCTSAENQRNRVKNKRNTSGFKGVTWSRCGRKWQAAIAVDGENIYLGYFVNPQDAARAYDRAAKKYHGEFAHLNFNDK